MGKATAFAMITTRTAGYDVFPIRFSLARYGDDMIKSELVTGHFYSAILALKIIAHKNVGPSKSDFELTFMATKET